MPKTQTVFITRFVESQGIFPLEVEMDPNNPNQVLNPRQNKTFKRPDWFEDIQQAKIDAEQRLIEILESNRQRTNRVQARLEELRQTTDH